MRSYAIHEIGPVQRLVHDAAVTPLQPMIKPTQTFLQEPDGWTGDREVRVLVNPWTSEPSGGGFEIREHSGDRVAVRIAPATDGEGLHLRL